MTADDNCAFGNPEPFVMVSHADFTKALALLGVDVEHVFGVSIGPWTDADTELWSLAPMMQRHGAFWRVRATTDGARPTLSDLKVRYIGIEHPKYGED
jgi:hypothetical protein